MLLVETETAARLAPGDREAWMAEVRAWYDRAEGSGALADSGHELRRPETARTIRAGRVVDGPYIEAKEVLGGYAVLEADTIDGAVALARTWPGVDRGYITVEVRPVVVHQPSRRGRGGG
jgi:hypothetical protein